MTSRRSPWQVVSLGALLLLLLRAGAAAEDAGGTAVAGVLTGKVVDAEGEPVAGAGVSLWTYALQRESS